MSHHLLFSCLPSHILFPPHSEFSTADHRAGSPGDESLGNKVLNRFKEYGMNSWTDEHFVKVQDPPASGYNKFVFKNGSEERLDGFLSYSGNGAVKVNLKTKREKKIKLSKKSTIW